MGRRSPAKNKTSQNKKPPVYGSAPDVAMGSTAAFSASLDSNIAPRLEPAGSDEPWSPSRNALRSPTKPLAHQVTSLQQEKEIIDTKLWDTTVELQERIRQAKEDNDRIERLQNELNRLRSDKEEDSHLLESLKGREDELRAALQSASNQAVQDKKSFLEKLESRDEYIEGLQGQIEQLRLEVQSAAQKYTTPAEKEPVEQRVGDNTSASLNTDTSVELNFEGATIPQTPGSSELLSSSHQKRQTIALRNQLNKRRIENIELKRQLADVSARAGIQWSPDSDNDSDIDVDLDEFETTQSSLPDTSHLGLNGGFTLSDEIAGSNELQGLSEQNDSQVAETLHNQARAINHALIPMAEYEKLSNQEALSDNSIDFERLKQLAAQLNFSVLPNEEYEHINRLLHGDKSIKKEVESHVLQDLVRQNTIALRSPSKRPLESRAAQEAPETVRNYVRKNDLILIPHSPSAVYELAKVLDLDVTPKKESKQLDDTSRKQSSVDFRSSQQEITAAAASLGLAVIPVKQLERLQSDTKKAGQPPNAADVAELAKLAGLQVIPENPTVDELRHITSDDMVVVEREIYEALENPGPATLSRLANANDLAILPKSEVEQLRSQKREQIESQTAQPTDLADLSEDSLKSIAEKRNLVVLSAEDYQKMISVRPARDFSNLPMAERTGFFEKLINAQNNSTSPSRQSPSSSLGSMAERIGGMGFLIVKKEEYAQLKESQKMYNPTKADIINSAKEYGLATMPIDEYAKLRSTKWSSPLKDRKASTESSPSKGNSPRPKGEEEFKEVPSSYLSALQRIVETPSSIDVESMARKAGLHVLEAEGNRDVVLTRAKELGMIEPLSTEEIAEKAKAMGMIALPTDEEYLLEGKTRGLVEPLTDSDIIQRATELGFEKKLSDDQIKTAAQGLGLIYPLTDDEIIAAARKLGLVDPLTDKEILAAARSLGLVDPVADQEVVERAQKLGLSHRLSDDELKDAARNLGLTDPISDDDIKRSALQLGLVEPFTDGEVLSTARKLGLIDPLTEDEILGRASQLGWASKLSDDDIKSHARKLGLNDPLGDDEIMSKGRVLGLVDPLTDDEIVNRAKHLGLAPELSNDDILSKGRSLGLVDPVDDDQVVSRAKQLGMVSKLSNDEVANKARSLGLIDPLTDDDIVSRAKGLGLVSQLSDDEVRSKALGLGLINPLTDDEVVSRAKGLGLISKHSHDEIKSEAHSLGLVKPLSDDEIITRAKGLGLISKLSNEEIKSEAYKLGLVTPLSDDEIITHAKGLGLTSKLSNDDIKSEARGLGLVDPLTDEQIVTQAKGLGLTSKLSGDDIKSEARGLGLVDPLTDEEVVSRAKALGLISKPSDDEIKSKAHKLGLVKPLSDDEIITRAKGLGLASQLSSDEIKTEAHKLGLIDPLTDDEIVSRAKGLGLISNLSDDEITNKARSLGLVDPLTDDEIVSRAKKLGLISNLSDKDITDKARSLGLVDPPTDHEIVSRAQGLGMTPKLSKDGIRLEARSIGLVEPPSDNEVMQRAMKLGLAPKPSDQEILSKARSLDPITDEKILGHAKRLGLVPEPSDDDIRDKAHSLGLIDPLTDLDVIGTKKLGLAPKVNSNDKLGASPRSGPIRGANKSIFDKPKQPLGPSSSSKPDYLESPASPDNIAQNAVDTGLVSSRWIEPSASDAALNIPASTKDASAKPEPVKSGEVVSEATEFSQKTTDAEQGAGDGRRSQSSNDIFTAGKPNEVAAAAVGPRSFLSQNRLSDIASEGKVSSAGLPKTLATTSSPQRTVRKFEVRSTPRRSNTRASQLSRQRANENQLTDSPASRQDEFSRVQRLTGRPTHSRADTESSVSENENDVLNLPPPGPVNYHAAGRKNTGMSQTTLSTWSLRSLTPDDASQYLAQLVMGEVLYKYYGGLNFEGITGGRHRRFFWFRPDKRRLFWSRENPQFFGHANPRSITIADVSEQIDRNPLPAGLYHRTLIIRGVERDVRVTCANQGRHYVWLATLRHIISQKGESM